MDHLDIRLLRIFMTLMSEMSVTRAAIKLGVSQSALSQSLARLRVIFNDPLLLRSRGRMVPTDRAVELSHLVRDMFGYYDAILESPHAFDPVDSKRRFVVTAPEYAEHMLMPALMERLRQEAPGIRVEVRAPQPDRAVEQLESGEVDLRIAWLLSPASSLRSVQLFQDRVVCLARKPHPSVRGRLDLNQFLSLPHVRPLGTGRSTTTQILDEAVAREGLKIERPILVQNFLTVPLIVSRTDMLATLPKRLAETFIQQHRLQICDIPLRLPRVRYAAYWHERQQKDPGHRWLRELLVQTSAALRA